MLFDEDRNYTLEELEAGYEISKVFQNQLPSVGVVDFNGRMLDDQQRVTRFNDLRAFQLILESQ
jgi:hypothetical protein